MLTDRQGNGVTGATREALDLYDEGLAEFNLYRGDPVARMDGAMAAARGFVMAHVMKAWLFALSTEPEATAMARGMVETAKLLPANERESSHLAVLGELLDGRWNRAATLMDFHNARWPRDLLALQAGHVMDFFRGSARSLRDRIGRTLPFWSDATPGYSVVLGMHAFGLEEAGDYARAEESGRRAVETEPRDCWAHHAVAHIMEMQGRAEDGIGWMLARQPHWAGDDNFFKIHNWWHMALCHLDLGQSEAVLGLYDGPIRSGRSAIAIDMVDASALLWRVHLTGVDVGDRWDELARMWDRHADGRLYPFNDWHAVMAYLGAGREGEVARVLASLEATARGESDVAHWARTIAIPMVHGFAAFWHGDYPRAAEILHPLRFVANAMGGSHAQRDIIDWTMTEAAIRGGMRELAQSFAQERMAVKMHSPINRAFLERAGRIECCDGWRCRAGRRCLRSARAPGPWGRARRGTPPRWRRSAAGSISA
ncbi:MAG TPA: tetratricopeptide repeat protein [Geminicoccaceae bacterium]|nr:tetratricopeptide repeat protein [Geminicoccaceae bacterium]